MHKSLVLQRMGEARYQQQALYGGCDVSRNEQAADVTGSAGGLDQHHLLCVWHAGSTPLAQQDDILYSPILTAHMVVMELVLPSGMGGGGLQGRLGVKGGSDWGHTGATSGFLR